MARSWDSRQLRLEYKPDPSLGAPIPLVIPLWATPHSISIVLAHCNPKANPFHIQRQLNPITHCCVPNVSIPPNFQIGYPYPKTIGETLTPKFFRGLERFFSFVSANPYPLLIPSFHMCSLSKSDVQWKICCCCRLPLLMALWNVLLTETAFSSIFYNGHISSIKYLNYNLNKIKLILILNF